MSTSLPLAAMPNGFEAHLVFQDGRYVLQLRPKTDNCVVRVLRAANGRYRLRLGPKPSLSVDTLQTLLDRALSNLALQKVRSIGEDTWQALDDIERAAAVPVVLSAAQAARKRKAILTRAHYLVLAYHSLFLVMLGRAPSDYSIHDAAPRELQALENAVNGVDDDDDEGEDDDDDEEEGDDQEDDDEDNDKVCDDNDDDDETDDDDDESSNNDDDETPIMSVAFAPDRPWWQGYLDAMVWDQEFRRRYGQKGRLQNLVDCLVFWDEAHPFPDALLRRFMPKRGAAAVDPASGEKKEAPEPSVADFLQPLVEENIVQTHLNGHLCVPLWYRYFSQRHMRFTGRYQSVFATMLRILGALGLQPLESQVETWDGYVIPPLYATTYLTALAYMKLLVPYGKVEDGSAEWERVGRRYHELREQGVPMALQECPLGSLPVEGAETPP